MAKIKTVICDCCGQEVYRHARWQYKVLRRFPEAGLLWERVDLCESCWNEFCKIVIEHTPVLDNSTESEDKE